MIRLFIILKLCLLSSLASAGQLVIYDEAHVLTPEGELRIAVAAKAWSFNATVVLTNAPSWEALEDRLPGLLARPPALVLGVDPNRRVGALRFGPGLNLPKDAWTAVARAGNAEFKVDAWADGAVAVGNVVHSRIVQAPPPSTAPPLKAPLEKRNTLDGLSWLGFGIVALLLIGMDERGC